MDRDLSWYMRWLVTAIVTAGSFAICLVAIHEFYGLHGEATLYPYTSPSEQWRVIARVALLATTGIFWSIFLGTQGRYAPRTAAMWTGVGALATLTLYGVLGCGGVLGNDLTVGSWHGSTEFFFPSLVFSEFNFLTFIFEVAPTTAGTASLLVLVSRISMQLAATRSAHKV
jgi:hypothetical protein